MTIRHYSRHADLVSYSYIYISSNISVSLKNLIIFSTSQLFPSSVLMSPWILYFLLLFLYWGSLVGNVWLLVSCLHILHFCKLLVVHFLTSNVNGIFNVWKNIKIIDYITVLYYKKITYINVYDHLDFKKTLPDYIRNI